MSNYKDHEDFFKAVGEERIATVYVGEKSQQFTVEEMYQFFKQRYDAEKKQEKLDQFIEDRQRSQ